MTAELPPACHGFGIWANGHLAASMWLAVFPHPTAKDIVRDARLVTLPDYQGLGLAFVLADTLGAALKAGGRRLRHYPAHPALIGAFGKSTNYSQIKEQGFSATSAKGFGDRFTAVFEWVGPANPRFAKALGVQRQLGPGDEPADGVAAEGTATQAQAPHVNAPPAPPLGITMGPGDYLVVPMKGYQKDTFRCGGLSILDGALVIFDEDGQAVRRVFNRGTWKDVQLVKPRVEKADESDGAKVTELRGRVRKG